MQIEDNSEEENSINFNVNDIKLNESGINFNQDEIGNNNI
jgi:hypothetical protein